MASVDFKLVCEWETEDDQPCETEVWASDANEISRSELDWTCPNPKCASYNYVRLDSYDG